MKYQAWVWSLIWLLGCQAENDADRGDLQPDQSVDSGALDSQVDRALAQEMGAPDQATVRDALVDLTVGDAQADQAIDVGLDACGDAAARCGPLQACVDSICVDRIEILDAWANHARGRVFAGVRVRVHDDALSPNLRVDGQHLRPFHREGAYGGSGRRPDGTRYIEGVFDAEVAPATVDLVSDFTDASRILMQIEVVERPVGAVGEPCTKLSGIDACARGLMCVVDDIDACPWVACRGELGRCLPIDASLIRVVDEGEDEFVLDIVGERLDWQDSFALRIAGDERLFISSVRWPVSSRDRVRQSIQFRLLGEVGSPIEVIQSHNIIAAALDPLPQVIRQVGEACDPRGVRDLCSIGLLCLEGQCREAEEPRIEAARVVAHDGMVSIWATGRAPNRDLSQLYLNDEWLGRLSSAEIRSPANVVYTNDRFELLWSGALGGLPEDGPGALAVERSDGGMRLEYSANVESSALGPPVGAGAQCDIAGLIWRCADGLICEKQPAVGLPTCQPPTSECPPGRAVEVQLDTPLNTDAWRRAPWEPSALTCFWFVRERGAFFRFEAPEAGRYRFSAGSPLPLAIAIRRACLLPSTEDACTFENRAVEGAYLAQAELDMEAGQVVTVIVKGNGFRLTVDRL